jgi:hypothetical protein
MKLPVQAAAVLRHGSGLAGRLFGSGVTGAGVEPSGCQTCRHGPNPCKGTASQLVSCASGACQCCSSATSYHQDRGGACLCGP